MTEPPVAYLDHAASTPLRAEAREAVVAVLDSSFANPSGSHRAARAARQLVDEARDVVADALGARTLAEGVETREQFDWLRAQGCHLAQGWLFARALPAVEIPALFHRNFLTSL